MQTRRSRVLVVDANPRDLEAVCDAIGEQAEVVRATDARAARAVLTSGQIDLCLTDLQLPGMSGLELLLELRARHPEVGRILLSHHTEPLALLQAIDAGAVFRFLAKPVDPAQLRRTLLEFERAGRHGPSRDTVLVVDDTRSIRSHLELVLHEAGYEVLAAEDGVTALELLRQREVTVAVVDLEMPGMTGLELVSRAKAVAPEVPTIVLSAHVHHQLALGCMAAGAFDFMPKPASKEETLFRVKRGIAEAHRLAELSTLHGSQRGERTPLLAASPGMRAVLSRAQAVAASDETVLITGETGAGKDALAREIHRLSPRAQEQFFAVNCGALPETLLEAELFGHEKGAFTGAHSRRKGYFEIADGGTLFLDELGEMTPATQVKLLRVLEDKQVVRLGGALPVKVDVRVIAATNRNLEEMVAAKTFRSDLYYRLYVLPIHLPPLRERREDIPGLLKLALERAVPRRSLHFSGEALDEAMTYDWPGNVRELFNAVARAATLCPTDRIETLGLPARARTAATLVGDLDASPGPTPNLALPLKEYVSQTVEAAERKYLQAVLQKTGGALGEAAKLAGVDRKSVYNKMKSYGLDKADFKARD